MEKVMEFSNEEKSLIWERFVSPANGTESEAQHFIETSEKFGLDPLLGDIVFQKYNTKNGPKTQFITTRDGLLRVATHQPDYRGAPNANVVREGDIFKFMPSEGKVHHEFGQKRGQILGAYAVMKHKRFDPVAVFVDFPEYYQANSGQINNKHGYANVWDKHPSAMIQKVAESFVLRRQFPLGGLYTQEEMSLQEENQQNETPNVATNGNNQPVSNPLMNENDGSTQPINSGEASNNHEEPIQSPETGNQGVQAQTGNNDSSTDKANTKTDSTISVRVVSYEPGVSPKNVPYGKLFVVRKTNNKDMLILVKDNKEAMDELENITEGQTLTLNVIMENDFYFLKEILATPPVEQNAEQTDVQNTNENTEVKNEADDSEQQGEQTNAVNQQEPKEEKQVQQNNNMNLYVLATKKVGQMPNGEAFAKLNVKQQNGAAQTVLAQGNEAVNEVSNLAEGEQFTMETRSENGFIFFVTLGEKNAS